MWDFFLGFRGLRRLGFRGIAMRLDFQNSKLFAKRPAGLLNGEAL